MITISAYIKTDDDCLLCLDKMISINSMGYYHLKGKEIGKTLRANGREDYQIIYIAKGRGYFVFDNEEQEVNEGNIVLYRPGEFQEYRYDYDDESEIYWIHFTGYGVEDYLRVLNFKNKQVYEVGFHNEYTVLWNKMMTELQVRRIHYEVIVEGMMIQLLGIIARSIYEEKKNISRAHEYIQEVIEHMHRNSEEPISIKEYASRCNMSVCWFISNFKELTGMTPGQYITQIKINKAKELLTNTELNISEVADIIGYQNSFYFSRIFKKVTGMCPREWKK